MATPSEDIEAFLNGSEVPQARRPGVAAAFARSMLRELRASVAEWEAAAAALGTATRSDTAGGLVRSPRAGERWNHDGQPPTRA